MISHNVKQSDDLFVYEYDINDRIDFAGLKNKAINLSQTINNYSHKLMHNMFMSGYNVHRQTNEFDDLVNVIENITNEKAKTILGNINVEAQFKMLESWIIVYKKFGYVENHNHFPFGYSAVCYISAENTSNIQFHDVEIEAKTGKLLLFPGVLSHKVKPVLPNHSERIVFACNLYPSFDYSYFKKLDSQFIK